MKKFLLKMLKMAALAFFEEVLAQATSELNDEVGARFDDEEALVFRSGIKMLAERVALLAQEKL